MKTLSLMALVVMSQVGFPAMAQAEGCHDKVKVSCADGSAWDEETKTCAPKPSA